MFGSVFGGYATCQQQANYQRAIQCQQEASRRACVSQHLMAQPGVVSVRWKPNASRPVVVRMGKTNIPEVKHG